MINGSHVILYSTDPEADRAFLRDKLSFANVDAGGGWLVFKLPPAELGVHPTEHDPTTELYLMCDDLEATIAALEADGVKVAAKRTTARWGILASVKLPSGASIGLYQPLHPVAYDL